MFVCLPRLLDMLKFQNQQVQQTLQIGNNRREDLPNREKIKSLRLF